MNLLEHLTLPQPLDAPSSGTSIGRGITLFHDAGDAVFQVARSGDALRSTVEAFDGTYLSVAIDMPDDLSRQISAGRTLVLTLDADLSRRLTTFCRLNVASRNGTEEIHETVVFHVGPRVVPFDLDRLQNSEVHKAWFDLIFAAPENVDIKLLSVNAALENT